MTAEISTGSPAPVAGALRNRLGAVRDGHLVICSASCLPIVTELNAGTNVVTVAAARTGLPEIAALDSSIEWSRFTTVTAVGGGSVIDVAKVLAARHGVRLAVAPSVLSCNAFATGKSVVSSGAERLTVDSVIPDQVLIDPALLRLVPMRLHLLGLADVLSIHTALHDWRLAAKAGVTSVDMLVSGIAETVLEYAFDAVEALFGSTGDDAYGEIARLLSMSGFITAFYGSGRPESGSEHLFARAIEQDQRGRSHVWHGESVLLGVLLLARLQQRQADPLFDMATQAGLYGRILELGLTPPVIAELLLTASRLRPDRYTVFDAVGLTPREALDCATEVSRRLQAGRDNGRHRNAVVGAS